MKKFLFLGIAATAMFASCTNDEMVEMNPQSAIGFETFVDKSTRATDVQRLTLQLLRFMVGEPKMQPSRFSMLRQ